MDQAVRRRMYSWKKNVAIGKSDLWTVIAADSQDWERG